MKRKISFKEALPQLRALANKIVERWGDEFEVDELVNEAWILSEHKDEAIDLPLLLRTVHLDMIDYVRKRIGRKQLKAKRPKYITNTTDSDSQRDNPENGHQNDFLSSYFSIADNWNEEFENRDLIEFLLSVTPPKQTEVLRKYFLEQKSLIEVGKELGLADSSICNLKKAGLEICREELERMEIL